MEQFIVSARKYRPQTFQEVVGQQAITNTLVNAIESNHLAQALLFTGPRGVGKTTCARILARKINQVGYDDPTEDFTFNVFELDAASNNSVDDIRNLIDQVRIPPQTGKYKVYIIDEVHMLSTAAFNAFLKTLEEPPRHAIFILATTEKHKIIPTILSRCQIFDFKRITIADAADHLALVANSQGITYEPDALRIIAQKADGAMRDALSIFDRVVSYCGKNLTRQAVAENLNVLDFEYYIRVTDLILANNIPALLTSFDSILAKGFDAQHFIAGLASHFRNLMVCKTPETAALLEVGEHGKQLFEEQAKKASVALLLEAIDLANDADLKYKASQNQRLLVELCLMKLASLSYEGEKKKDKSFIIPVEALTAITPMAAVELPTTPVQQNNIGQNTDCLQVNNVGATQHAGTSILIEEKEIPAVDVQEPYTQESVQQVKEPPLNFEVTTPSLNTMDAQEAPALFELAPSASTPVEKKVSALSLSSIRARKEMESSLEKKVVNPDDLPKEPFTVDQFMGEWNKYAEKLARSGFMLMSSLMGMVPPVIQGTSVSLEMPNEGSKLSFDENKFDLVNYLRKKLNNFDIEIEITVNEEVKIQKRVLDKEDKLVRFIELNPAMQYMKEIFDLEFKY